MVPWLGEEEAQAAAEAVRSGWVAQGPRVAEFERCFAAAVGAPHGVAVSSGTTALHLALLGAGVGPGDEVVVPSFSYVATANAVRHAGAEVVFADVEEATGNLAPAAVAPLLGPRTRAVVLVDQAGVPADLDAMRALCDPRGVAVVEDAACAAGSLLRGCPVGAGAELAAFSFHPRKLLTTGEGGMVLCADGAVAERLRRLREHGVSAGALARFRASGEGRAVVESYDEVGFNYRMTDIQAAVGLVQLGRLRAAVAERRRLAEAYRLLLAEALPGWRMVGDPAFGEGNYQSCWVLGPDGFGRARRDAVLGRMAAAGVAARRGISAIHTEPAYRGTGVRGAGLPATERLADGSLVLPLFHGMGAAVQRRVVAALADAARG
ncbi:glutamine--scyllo-inositol aminotransferase [Mangrovactinospora gilvigrisea]|uniref:Glutamine--scyllo-inositol aminotransferase n=2 Tax=Mangrovactinospora gilvigrisea TaxID=1428644 RepID=A0A1J7BJN5_9ACTN|nr:glutamine--scyllo-inositol aminotransferase [Mangrovactinospora gilvigrisea]